MEEADEDADSVVHEAESEEDEDSLTGVLADIYAPAAAPAAEGAAAPAKAAALAAAAPKLGKNKDSSDEECACAPGKESANKRLLSKLSKVREVQMLRPLRPLPPQLSLLLKMQLPLPILPREHPLRMYLNLPRRPRSLFLRQQPLRTNPSLDKLPPNLKYPSIEAKDMTLELRWLLRIGKRLLYLSMRSGKLTKASRRTSELQ